MFCWFKQSTCVLIGTITLPFVLCCVRQPSGIVRHNKTLVHSDCSLSQYNWIKSNTAQVYFITARNEVGAMLCFTGVCDSVHRWGLPQCMLGYHPPGTRHPPRADPPPRAVTPNPYPPRSSPPPGAEHAGRYGQHAGGTHPTGMQFCIIKEDRATLKFLQYTRMDLISTDFQTGTLSKPCALLEISEYQ